MAVVIINPNSTRSMTTAMLEQAKRSAPDITFEGWTSEDGPAAIQGEADGLAATPPLLRLVAEAAAQGADGIIIGCFDDTALPEAAQLANCPVIGIGQAAYHYAALRNWRYSVVTTLSVSLPVINDNINRYGLSSFAARVRASEVPVLALENDPAGAARAVAAEAKRAEREDDISAVILGCAGMVQVLDTVQDTLGIHTIDPVACAARSMRWLA